MGPVVKTITASLTLRFRVKPGTTAFSLGLETPGAVTADGMATVAVTLDERTAAYLELFADEDWTPGDVVVTDSIEFVGPDQIVGRRTLVHPSPTNS